MALVSSPINPGMNLQSLLPETAEDGEIFNLDENGELQQGQLRRFLKILGPKLDEAKGLVDAFPTMLDADHTDADLLPLMAKLVGVEFNREIPIPQAREEIKGAVQWYKRKGTVDGCRIHGYRISRLQTDIVEFVYNVKTSNREYSFSADNEGEAIRNYQLPGDLTAFSYDFEHRSIIGLGHLKGLPVEHRMKALFLLANYLDHGSPPITRPDGGYYTSLTITDDPSRQLLASSHLPGHEAWHVADNIEATCWISPDLPAFLYFSFDEETLPILLRIKAGLGLQTFAVEWSDDFANWVTVGEHVYGDISEFTQGLGKASGSEETKVLFYNPVTEIPELQIFVVSSVTNLHTQTAAVLNRGDSYIQVADTSGFIRGDWIQLSHHTQAQNGYYQLEGIEGNLLNLRVPIAEHLSWPIFSAVKKVNVQEKTVGEDFTVDYWTGFVTLLDGKFFPNSEVFAWYVGLRDTQSIEIWQEFPVIEQFMEPHYHWRIRIDSTWRGLPSICELEVIDDQFWGTYYRCERLGYFFTLGNHRPGCDGDVVCNKPLLAETVQKLCRTMPEAVPVGRVPVMVGVDCRYPEEVDLTAFGQDFRKDAVHTFHREVFDWYGVVPDIFLLSNTRRTGSVIPTLLGYVSMKNWKHLAMDFWHDVTSSRALYSVEGMGSPPIVNDDGEYYVSAFCVPN